MWTRGGGGQKIRKFCGHHMWKLPNRTFLNGLRERPVRLAAERGPRHEDEPELRPVLAVQRRQQLHRGLRPGRPEEEEEGGGHDP